MDLQRTLIVCKTKFGAVKTEYSFGNKLNTLFVRPAFWGMVRSFVGKCQAFSQYDGIEDMVCKYRFDINKSCCSVILTYIKGLFVG